MKKPIRIDTTGFSSVTEILDVLMITCNNTIFSSKNILEILQEELNYRFELPQYIVCEYGYRFDRFQITLDYLDRYVLIEINGFEYMTIVNYKHTKT